MTERVMRATAQSFVISPTALGGVAPDPRRGVNEFSARWMLAVAARLVQEVGILLDRAGRAHRPLATFTIDSELRFASAVARSRVPRFSGAAMFGSMPRTSRRRLPTTLA